MIRDTVEKECVIFAMGIRESGNYEILGFYMNPVENHIAYRNVLMDQMKEVLKNHYCS
ncbi:transposase [Cuniculiplasma sp. SKW4]|uniref:transposase n=1 Tax=Cuniculiplasma sp. SKW4 TaxID=3400171 RepID=UPI003FD3083A